MRKNQRKNTAQHTTTITGTITQAPKRIPTRTGRVMAAATVLVESETRSPYPMQVIGFDVMALELMLHPRGQRLTVTGPTGYHNGYQITAREVVAGNGM
ncbi:TPA: hypothetical protein SMI12_004084 [Serratia liquefaciens]|nr:hypothetical protein [Serratia liquefaciens]